MPSRSPRSKHVPGPSSLNPRFKLLSPAQRQVLSFPSSWTSSTLSLIALLALAMGTPHPEAFTRSNSKPHRCNKISYRGRVGADLRKDIPLSTRCQAADEYSHLGGFVPISVNYEKLGWKVKWILPWNSTGILLQDSCTWNPPFTHFRKLSGVLSE